MSAYAWLLLAVLIFWFLQIAVLGPVLAMTIVQSHLKERRSVNADGRQPFVTC